MSIDDTEAYIAKEEARLADATVTVRLADLTRVIERAGWPLSRIVHLGVAEDRETLAAKARISRAIDEARRPKPR